MSDRKANLEMTISNLAGVAVELTVRGLKEFTFSFDGHNRAAANRIAQYFGKLASCKIEEVDCGEPGIEGNELTCVYVTVS